MGDPRRMCRRCGRTAPELFKGKSDICSICADGFMHRQLTAAEAEKEQKNGHRS